MKKIAVSFLALLATFSVSSILLTNKSQPTFVVEGYTNGDGATYYNGIDPYATGQELITALNNLNNNRRLKLISYDSLRKYFSETDPGTYSGQVTAFYSGTSAYYSGNMNREHVWPFSRLVINTDRETNEGKNDIEKDLHMVRPALASDNGERSNKFFTNPDDERGWDPGSQGDVTYRGDTARIVFYCVIADLGLSLVNKSSDATANHTMGKLPNLLEWNMKYPVSNREKVRNEAVEKIQGHRNPFIDHPEYAIRIYKTFNDVEIQRMLAPYGVMGNLTVQANNYVIDKYIMTVDKSVTFTAGLDTNYSNASYKWDFCNELGGVYSTDKASKVDNNNSSTITALKPGTTYIKTTSTVNVPNGKTETLFKITEIEILDKVRVENFYLEYFPFKDIYYVGDNFDPDGIKAIATFSNGTSKDVTDLLRFSDTTFDSAGNKTVTAYYDFDGETYEASFNVTVKEKTEPTPITPVTPSTPTSSGCGGNITTMSVILSTISLTGVVLIAFSFKRKRKN